MAVAPTDRCLSNTSMACRAATAPRHQALRNRLNIDFDLGLCLTTAGRTVAPSEPPASREE